MTAKGLSGRVRSSNPVARGFTLVELIVVISIIAVLISLLLAGVNGAREASRRAECSNHLRQLGLGLHNFHTSHDRFPVGNHLQNGTSSSWLTAILPQLEQAAINEQYDDKVDWYHPKNSVVIHTVIPTLRCPSSIIDFAGDTDYSGVFGSALAGEEAFAGLGLNNGVLIESSTNRRYGVSIPEIFDGSSYTICIAEVVDRLEAENGLWANSRNCISHDNGGINIENSDEIFSYHPGGSHVVLADGAVRFLSQSTAPSIVGALCSRRGKEDIREAWGY